MKKLTAFILTAIFTVSVALAIINTTFSEANTDFSPRYASITVDVPNGKQTPPDTGNDDNPDTGDKQ